jgi:hypothetical protein
MTMHIYAFGSVCRGDISPGSDIDLLAIVEGHDARFDRATYSIYSYKRICELWFEGNPFAWHLSLESRLIFASDLRDFIGSLGVPAPYKNCLNDCKKFSELFHVAHRSAVVNGSSRVFDLSTIFLGIRNFATCFALGVTSQPNFSRNSARHLNEDSIQISDDAYSILERARILATRGYGARITDQEFTVAIRDADDVAGWMSKLLEKVECHARIQ